jgi:hypothetical protein
VSAVVELDRGWRLTVLLIKALDDRAERPLCQVFTGFSGTCAYGFVRDVDSDIAITQTLIELLSAGVTELLSNWQRFIAEKQRRHHSYEEDAHGKSDFSIRMHPKNRGERESDGTIP